MTSGVFESVPIDFVHINRAGRQRRELTGINDLAASIAKVGLIHPPVITHDGNLIVGERRVTAMRQLGWDRIPIQYIEDLPEAELRLVELEENVKRTELPWQDQCRAVLEYHTLRGWSTAETAEALGLDVGTVANKVQIAKELQTGNERVAAAPLYSTARNIVAREAERRADALTLQILERPRPAVPLEHANFHEWGATYSGPRFNLIHCDFPYGIGADEQAQGTAVAQHGSYRDSFDIYARCLDTLEQGLYAGGWVAESAHLVFWFSMDYYEYTVRTLTAMGWRVDRFPLIWYKSDNTGMLPDPQRGPRRAYETALFARRGDRKVVASVSNVCAHAVTKEWHMSEKPVGMLKHFFRMLVDEHTALFDPTAGSGNALIAAKAVNPNASVYGLEWNEEFFRNACANWEKNHVGVGAAAHVAL